MLRLTKLLVTHFPKLKYLTFAEGYLSKVTADGYRALAMALISLKSLKKLNLSLKPRFKQPSKAYSAIAPLLGSIKSIKLLKALVLKFYTNIVIMDQRVSAGDLVISKLAESMRHQPKLRALNLSIADSNRVSPNSIICLANVIPRLVKLARFKLAYPRLWSLPKNLSEIVVALKSLKHLSSLSLNFPECNASPVRACPKAQETLAHIASLTRLAVLDLDFGSGYYWQILSDTATSIQQLKQLSSLSLGLSGGIDESNQVRMVRQKISESILNLNKLIELDFCLHACKYIHPEFIRLLAETIELKHLKLKALNLTLRGVQNLSDTHLRELARAIENLQNLTRCSINISSCFKIKEPGIAAIFQSIGYLRSLTTLELHVNGGIITDTNLNQLKASLAKLTHLTSLRIKFSDSEHSVKLLGLEQIKIAVSHLSKIKELSVDIQ
jgi:hypothetical protein